MEPNVPQKDMTDKNFEKNEQNRNKHITIYLPLYQISVNLENFRKHFRVEY